MEASAIDIIEFSNTQVITGRGDCILLYAEDLIACLKKCFYMKSKFAIVHTARVSAQHCGNLPKVITTFLVDLSTGIS